MSSNDHNRTPQELQDTPVGFDPGNRAGKLVVKGQKSKVNLFFAAKQPQGRLNDTTLKTTKAKAFWLQVGDIAGWVGEDALSQRGISELDEAKYTTEYLKSAFSASVVQWMISRKVSPETVEASRFNIVASMPPEKYQDGKIRAEAASAFSEAFAPDLNWHVKTDVFPTFRIYTCYKNLVPETLVTAKSVLKDGKITVVVDFGYGTLDLAVFNGRDEVPKITNSYNMGLFHAYSELSPLNINGVELDIWREKDWSRLDGYFSEAKRTIEAATRRIPNECLNVVIIGGGTKAMSPYAKKSYKKTWANVSYKDEFANALANYRVACRETG